MPMAAGLPPPTANAAPVNATPAALLCIVACAIGWPLGASTVFVSQQLPRSLGIIGALLYVLIVLLGGVLLGAVRR
jgi:hypothetical protein